MRERVGRGQNGRAEVSPRDLKREEEPSQRIHFASETSSSRVSRRLTLLCINTVLPGSS